MSIQTWTGTCIFCKENLNAPTLSRACRYSLRLTAYFCEHVKAGDQIFFCGILTEIPRRYCSDANERYPLPGVNHARRSTD